MVSAQGYNGVCAGRRRKKEYKILNWGAGGGYTCSSTYEDFPLFHFQSSRLPSGNPAIFVFSNTKTLNTSCIILRCQPFDVIEIVPTDGEKIKYFYTTLKSVVNTKV